MIEIIENCQVEWDLSRGVLYVHDKDTGRTVVRICGLKKIQNGFNTRTMLCNSLLDITRPEHVQYPIEQ